jgi:hypothetical protein
MKKPRTKEQVLTKLFGPLPPPEVLERCYKRAHALGQESVTRPIEVTVIKRARKWITVECKDGRARVRADGRQSWWWGTLDDIDVKVGDRAFLFETRPH